MFSNKKKLFSSKCYSEHLVLTTLSMFFCQNRKLFIHSLKWIENIYILHFKKNSQNASWDGYIAVLITLLKRFPQTIKISAQMPDLNEKLNLSRQKISPTSKMSLWTLGKFFLQPCWKISSLMSENFLTRCRKFQQSLILLLKKDTFLQNVTLNTYKVVLTTRLKFFDRKLKKIEAIIYARSIEVFAKYRLEETVFLLFKASNNFEKNFRKMEQGKHAHACPWSFRI